MASDHHNSSDKDDTGMKPMVIEHQGGENFGASEKTHPSELESQDTEEEHVTLKAWICVFVSHQTTIISTAANLDSCSHLVSVFRFGKNALYHRSFHQPTTSLT